MSTIFEEVKTNKGWTLSITKINELIFKTRLDDNFGKLIEIKSFRADKGDQMDLLADYINLFNDDPKKNLNSLRKIKA